jgi:hypothetical protein
MGMYEGAQVREARLVEFERRRSKVGHSAVDVPILVAECRRFRSFLAGLADEIDTTGPTSDLSARLRDAARAVGE